MEENDYEFREKHSTFEETEESCSLQVFDSDGSYRCGVYALDTVLDNKYYDPEIGLIEGEYTHGKITSFLEIYAE